MTQRRRTIPRQSSGSDGQPLGSESVVFNAQPEYDPPDLPRDLTVTSDQKLMTMFSEYVAWQNYAATKLAECEVEEERAEAEVRKILAEGFVLNVGGSAKVTETRAAIENSEEMQRAKDRVIDAYAARKMIAVVYANCERVVNLLSRELTRRVGREIPERRVGRWNP